MNKPKLDLKDTGGNVGKPEYKDGVSTYIPGGNRMASLDTSVGLNPGASQENLSAKFKYPNKRQELPEKARNQYQ